MLYILLLFFTFLLGTQGWVTKFAADCFVENYNNLTARALDILTDRFQADHITSDEKDFEAPLSLNIWGLQSVNEFANAFTITAYVDYTQQISALKWDPTKYCNISSINLHDKENKKKVFLPTVQSPQIIDIQSSDYQDWIVRINSDGKIVTDMIAVGAITASCNLLSQNYPRDVHRCTVSFQVNGFVFVPIVPSCKMDIQVENPSWVLHACHTRAKKNIVYFDILIGRKPYYYILVIVVPTIMLANVNPVIFLLPAKSGIKVALGVSLLIVFFLYLMNLTRRLPVGNPSHFLYYVLAVLTINCASTLIAGIFQLMSRHKFDNFKIVVSGHFLTRIFKKKDKDGNVRRKSAGVNLIQLKYLNTFALIVIGLLEIILDIWIIIILGSASKVACDDKTCEFEGKTFQINKVEIKH